MDALERDYWNGLDLIIKAGTEANVSTVVRAAGRKSRTPLQMERVRFAELHAAIEHYEAERHRILRQVEERKDLPKLLGKQLNAALSVAAGYMIALSDEQGLRSRAERRVRRTQVVD
jgi:hypothetical protein